MDRKTFLELSEEAQEKYFHDMEDIEAERDSFRAENETLRADNDTLKADNKELKTSNYSLARRVNLDATGERKSAEEILNNLF